LPKELREVRVAQQAEVLGAIEDDVLVDLVRYQGEVMAGNESTQAFDIVVTEYSARRIVRRVQKNRARSVVDGVFDPLPVDAEIRRLQGDAPGDRAVEPDARLVGVVCRIEHDDLVARMQHRGQGAVNGLGRARRDHDLAFRIDCPPIKRAHLGRDLPLQLRDPCERCILVVPELDVTGHRRTQSGRAIEIGKALRKVDGAEVLRHLRHDGEDRRAASG